MRSMATQPDPKQRQSASEVYMNARLKKNAAKNRAVLMYSTAVVRLLGNQN
jgi:hypothetical protein